MHTFAIEQADAHRFGSAVATHIRARADFLTDDMHALWWDLYVAFRDASGSGTVDVPRDAAHGIPVILHAERYWEAEEIRVHVKSVLRPQWRDFMKGECR
ncbi:hypothetical protein [Streptomyces sp. CBMA123]|uniref:hypothetical protein n=1 Tax=Streptomyces sp. CBMA123 TaxID=1896313 RepID=UPI0016619244|nr:hypothetical protein [Streptomyces sp. CBMA123]